MIMATDYPELIAKGKALQRAHVVHVVFGGQTRLAQLLGVTQSTVNHIIYGRRRSRRIERDVEKKLRRIRPDLVDLWSA